MDYTRGELRLQAFTNIAHGVAPSLLLTDPATAGPVSFGFSNRTIDFDIGHSRLIGTRHVLAYGANVRHNTFALNIAPDAPNRLEMGAYLEDEVFLGPVQLTLGGRLDKFANSGTPFFSPRVAAVWKPSERHSIVVSYNRAFRSPSVIENFLQLGLIEPIDLGALAAFRPLLPSLLPPGLPPAARAAALADLEDRLDRTTSTPFPLGIRVIGSEIPVPGRPAGMLGAESLTAYEVRYGASLGRATGLGAAMYLNRGRQSLIAVPVPADYDPLHRQRAAPGLDPAARDADDTGIRGAAPAADDARVRQPRRDTEHRTRAVARPGPRAGRAGSGWRTRGRQSRKSATTTSRTRSTSSPCRRRTGSLQSGCSTAHASSEARASRRRRGPSGRTC